MKDELLRLAEGCETATGPDRELDARIEAALAEADFETLTKEGVHARDWNAPAYTASLDAAMTLVPDAPVKGMGEFVSIGLWDTNGVHSQHIRASAWVAGAHRTYAATPALALCAAALRASVKEQNNGK